MKITKYSIDRDGFLGYFVEPETRPETKNEDVCIGNLVTVKIQNYNEG